MRMASFAGSFTVSVVSSAMQSVAESPGIQPTRMPVSAPAKPRASDVGLSRSARYACPSETKPSSMAEPACPRRSRKAHQEEFLENECDTEAGTKSDHDRQSDSAQHLVGGTALWVLQNGDRGRDEYGAREPEGQPVAHQDDAERQAYAQNDQEAFALGHRHAGCLNRVFGERTLSPGARQHQRAEKDDGETEKEGQETGNGIWSDVLIFQAIHLPGADGDRNAECDPAERGNEVRPRRYEAPGRMSSPIQAGIFFGRLHRLMTPLCRATGDSLERLRPRDADGVRRDFRLVAVKHEPSIQLDGWEHCLLRLLAIER